MDSADLAVRAQFDADPRSVRAARRLVTGALADWGLEHLDTSAALLVSEVATNALLHARSPFQVEVARRGGAVWIGVSDTNARGPQPRRHSLSAGTGRGLGLVATLSTDWGTDAAASPWRKTVWFELPVDPARLPEPSDGAMLEAV